MCRPARTASTFAFALAVLALSACAPKSTPAIAPASTPSVQFFEQIDAALVPPAGWQLEEKPSTRRNVFHLLWTSPSGRTALGIIRFTLVIPLPHDPVLWVFLQEMSRSEGAVRVADKSWDRAFKGYRLTVEGGRYTMRIKFTIRGLSGWMAYAGTLRDQAVDEAELAAALEARDGTVFAPK